MLNKSHVNYNSYNYGNSVDNATRSMKQIANQLRGLQNVLEDILDLGRSEKRGEVVLPTASCDQAAR